MNFWKVLTGLIKSVIMVLLITVLDAADLLEANNSVYKEEN